MIKHTNQTSEANRVLKDIDRIVEYLRTSGMRVSIINPLNGTLANTLNQISRAQICIGQDSSALHNLFFVHRDLIVIQTEKRQNSLHTALQISSNKFINTFNALQGDIGWYLDNKTLDQIANTCLSMINLKSK